MPAHELEQRLSEHLTEAGLLAPGEPVVVAVSGGSDSVALLHLLAAHNAGRAAPHPLHGVHLNHRLRGEASDQDAEYVRQLCRSINISCTIESCDVAALASAEGLSLEEAGRKRRFELFERVCLTVGAKVVALAHHADDNAETVLHRIVRGTGLRGLAGIAPVRPLRRGGDIRVIRPLLQVRRQEIEAYLADRSISAREDASNQLTTHTRNRVRHEVLPLLRERFNPQVVEALLRLADQAAGLEAYLSETGERMLESMIVDRLDGQIVLHGPSLARKPQVIATQLVRQAITRLGAPEGDLSRRHLLAVVELAGRSEGSKTIDLPGGLRVSRRYARLIFEYTGTDVTDLLDSAEPLDVPVSMNGRTTLPVRGLEIDCEVGEVSAEAIAAHLTGLSGKARSGDEEWLDADQVSPPLLARRRRPGDRFFPLGMSGVKKVSDFFIDTKIEPAQRERTVILCDQLGPIWIVPLRIDQRVRLTRATRRVLRMRVRPMGADGT